MLSDECPTAIDPDEERLFSCQNRLGYVFADPEILRAALTHASGANTRLASNERLEFLGDAILGAVVCDCLYHRFPDLLEGELTRIKSVVVSRQTCAAISQELGLDECLIVGKGMASARRIPDSLMADVFESIVAAIFLDGGITAARDFVLTHLNGEIERADGAGMGDNYKSHLQQLAQRDLGETPTYRLLDEKGPDHDKVFKMAAKIGRQCYPAAWGRNKKEAEQRAARNALTVLDEQAPEPNAAAERPVAVAPLDAVSIPAADVAMSQAQR